ncbi:hypothetical protein GZH46_00983, partial [Fragariocoptes setiger]
MDEILSQVKKLFSNKNNSKLAQPWANRFHRFKMILLIMSITLMIGYRQFRAHFDCNLKPNARGNAYEKSSIDNACWNNGTFTVDSDVNLGHMPHVGIYFTEGGGKIVSHDHIPWLWAVLIVMLACSIMAEATWASTFADKVIKSVLRLGEAPKNDESSGKSKDIEKGAKGSAKTMTNDEQTQCDLKYISPVKLRNGDQGETKNDGRCSDLVPSSVTSTLTIVDTRTNLSHHDDDTSSNHKFQFPLQSVDQNSAASYVVDANNNEQCCVKFETVDNSYDKELDKYIEELVLFFTSRTSRRINLSKRYLRCEAISFMLTCVQACIPLIVIGTSYITYGWTYAMYTLYGSPEHLRLLWPIITQCRIEQFSATGAVDYFTTSCTVPLNALSGILFGVIWWFQAVDLIVQICEISRITTMYHSYNIARRLLAPQWRNVTTSVDYICRFPLILDDRHHKHQTSTSDNDDVRSMINVIFLLYLLRIRLGSRHLMEDVVLHLEIRLRRLEAN